MEGAIQGCLSPRLAEFDTISVLFQQQWLLVVNDASCCSNHDGRTYWLTIASEISFSFLDYALDIGQQQNRTTAMSSRHNLEFAVLSLTELDLQKALEVANRCLLNEMPNILCKLFDRIVIANKRACFPIFVLLSSS